ncbi:CorA metal ion transporter [Exophiala xenobiotica]|nr:CorA metal ion transporter [Exophiala xenobiotica]
MNPSSPTQPSTSADPAQARPSATPTNPTDGKKKRKHRGGKKRRNRRQSFIAPSETSAMQSVADGPHEDPLIEESQQQSAALQSFYRNNQGNRSGESLNSEALLDHRNQPTLRPRRDSRLNTNLFASSYRSNTYPRPDALTRRRHRSQPDVSSPPGSDEEDANDRTPLISGSAQRQSPGEAGYGLFRRKSRSSTLSSASKQQKKRINGNGNSYPKSDKNYDINNPPSVPPSPTLGARLGDVMVDDGHFLTRSPDSRRNLQGTHKDVLIDIEGDGDKPPNSAPPSPRLRPDGSQRHFDVEGDVCFPADEVSELGDYYNSYVPRGPSINGGRKRHKEREWPQVWVLDEWSRAEKEERAAGERRAKKISEPVFVEGRLRPSKNAWHRVEEDRQYRFTYFNEEVESTIHAETISELVQPGGSFRELFIPDPPELIDSSSSEEDADLMEASQNLDNTSTLQSPKSLNGPPGQVLASTLSEAVRSRLDANQKESRKGSGSPSPHKKTPPGRASKPKKYGPRPTFWLDVMSPNDQEMRVLCRTFGIHALTSEDIMMQEAREKVELFRNYYFINYRTFEQDTHSEDYLEPINMYMCVFRHGIITFHFSQIPHPANVRRRIRQLSDYLILSADWISYAIIDDITDVYQPLITSIEEEVDVIDDQILKSFQITDELGGDHGVQKHEKDAEKDEPEISGIDMLLRIGECRKKVMTLYRLLGTKADVIKGFAKRCNEQWEVAPKSEIGLYLGDIQDHILTMTGNLSHYETLLSRAHGNYLAQVSIHMNERQEKTSDVLGKLTVLGTIVLPMNIVTGMFGGNFKVPGQDVNNLNWFWGTTGALALFGLFCFFWCKKVYKIV